MHHSVVSPFFFNDTATTEIYTLSLHDALPVSGLISGPGGTPQSMGISASRSPDGTNWVLLVSSTPTGKVYTTTTLSMFRGDGTANLTATAWSSLSTATNGRTLVKTTSTATAVQPGDSILCKISWYVSGSQYRIPDGTNLLATGKLQ